MNLARALIFVLLALPALAQQPAQKPEAELVNPWLERAKVLTSEIQDDTSRLTWDQQALIPARLAQLWNKADPRRAHDLLLQAVDQVTAVPQAESEDHRKQRTESLRLLYDVAVPIDRAVAEKIMASLVDAMGGPLKRSGRTQPERVRTGMMISRAAGPLIEKDSQRAAVMIRQIIDLGDGIGLQGTIVPLAINHPELANNLMLEAVASARTDYLGDFIYGIVQVVYPAFPRPAPMNVSFSQQVQDGVLQLVSDAATRQPQNDDDRQAICRMVPAAVPLLPHYSPEQATAVRAAISSCNAVNEVQSQLKAQDRKLETSDDYFKAAEVESDLETRADYKLRAAILANQENDPLRALQIMENLTPEERDSRSPSEWNSQAMAFAVHAIRQLHDQHDNAAIQRVIDRVPDSERTMVLLGYALQWYSEDPSLAIQYTIAARRSLENSEPSMPSAYSALLTSYARALPAELPQVFSFCVAGLARYKPPTEPKSGVKWPDPWARLEPVGIPKAVMDLDDGFVGGTIKSVDNPALRESLRLGVLNAALRKYDESIQPQQPKTKPAATKKPVKSAASKSETK